MADKKIEYRHPRNDNDEKQRAYQAAKKNTALRKRTQSCNTEHGSCKIEFKVALPKNALQYRTFRLRYRISL